MSKLVVLIQSLEKRGSGIVGDPVRTVQTFWTVDGELVFEKDEYKPDAPVGVISTAHAGLRPAQQTWERFTRPDRAALADKGVKP